MRKLIVPLALAALTISSPAFSKSSKTIKPSSKSLSLVSEASAGKASNLGRSKSLSFHVKKSASKTSALAGASKNISGGNALAATAAIGAAKAAAATAVTISTPCATSDISPGANACAGFVAGNVINSGGGPADPVTGFSPNEQVMAELLAQLGFTYRGDADGIEQFDLNGGTTVDFAKLLVGQTIIGIHFGNGQGSPGGQGSGDDTAFYRFDAGLGLNTFDVKFGAGSTVTLFQTSTPAVPEPGSWAMMLLGFAGAGIGLRRTRRARRLTQIA